MQDLTEEWLKDAISKEHINYYDYDRFKVLETLGEGASGIVYKSYWIENDLTVALKSLKFDTSCEKTIGKFVKELRLLLKVCNHQNIIRIYGITKDDQKMSYHMILQFAEGGNLREYLKKSFLKLGWASKLRIAKEIAQGILFLHNNDIVHRDLHPQNILFHNDQVVISDFGLSYISTKTPALLKSSKNYGMAAFTDPQYFKDGSYICDKKSDIYSLGVLLWEISSGRAPFHNLSPLTIAIRVVNGEREKHVEGTPKEFIRLYKKCWDNNSKERPSSRSALAEIKI
ncbi:kinase-like protein [Gigaspora margarita]|uniref:Kinase-like protein n=1 Tax=Gigaspora margarita TaxID=4874 RepID=A0A8H3X7P1_GIGMA|nr:kinase-like protein [Gigaspora margarita]